MSTNPAGFVMLFDEALRTPAPPKPRVALWRLMIDKSYQGAGIGTAALELVIDYVRSTGRYSSLQVSYYPGPGCPNRSTDAQGSTTLDAKTKAR